MRRKLPILTLLLLLSATLLKAQSTYRSLGTGVSVDLGSAANWQTSSDGGATWVTAATAPTGLTSGSTITIQAGDTWANAIGTTTIPVGVTLTNNSTLLGTFTAAKLTVAGTLVYSGTAAQTLPASASFVSSTVANLTVNNALGVSSNGTISISGVVNLIAGQFNCNNGGGSFNYKGSITGTNGLLNVAGNFFTQGSAGQVIPGSLLLNNTINKLNVSTSTAGLNNFSSTGPIKISSGIGLYAGIFTLGGTLTVTGTTITAASGAGGITAGSNMVTFNGATAQTIPTGFFTGNEVDNITLSNALGVTSAGPLTVGTSYTATALKNTVTPLTVTGTVTIGGTLNISSFSTAPAVTGTTYTVLSATAISGTFNTLTLPVGYAGTVAYTSTVVTVTVSPSTDATLSSLALSSGTLSPAFASGTTSYTASVPNATSSITLTPTANEGGATIKVNGTTVASGAASGSVTLTVGNNTITTIVTAHDGTTTKTYTINLTRTPLSTDATLSNLTLSSGTLSPAFASGTIAYTASVPNATASITVTPTTNDATATVTVNGSTVTSGSASGSIALAVGSNTITTVVTAQDGTTTKTYTVNVTRTPLSTDATLSNLVLSSGTLSPAFSGATSSYTATVSTATTSIAVTPTTNDGTATLTVNGTSQSSGTASSAIPLAIGNNTITVVVTAQDGTTTQTYTTTVTRPASTDASLAGLTISSGTLSPSFSSPTTAYTVSVGNTVTSLTITPAVNDATATVTVNGTAVTNGGPSGSIALNVGGNTITTKVTAQDGVTTQTYTITVTRAASSNADLSNLTISSGTLTPAFAPATITYAAGVSIGTASITVTPTLADVTASVTVNGTIISSGNASAPITINTGSNTITAIVTAQDGSTKTYTLTITKTALSTNAALSGLSLSSGTLSPAFTSGNSVYTSSVNNATASITVTPIVADATATVTVNGATVSSGTASGAISLNVGTNTINVDVTAQDGVTKQTYSVAVTRAASSNANLSSLALSLGTLSPVFAAGTTTYTASVSNATISLTVTPATADATATITINGTTVNSGAASSAITLNVGANTLTTVVTAQDGTLKTYTVTITRAASTNANLASLAISSGTLSPVFASGTTAYSASVASSITSVTLTPTLSDATATVKVNGVSVAGGTASAAQPLVVGNNTINVVVTASDGVTTNTYVITVNRPGITQTLTFTPLSNVSYGAADFSPGATSTNSAIPVTYTTSNTAVATITAAGAIHVVGAGTTTITASQSGNSTYNAATAVQQNLVVVPAALTVTATNATKVYGAVLPTLSVAYTGLVNGDTFSNLTTQPVITTTATAASPVGSYTITASGAASANYAISYVAGTLSVTLAPLTITANNATTVYGSAAPALTATYNGFVNGDNATKLTAQPTLTTTYTNTSVAGTYPITASGAASANYSITYVAGTLTAAKAVLTVTANNATKVYGAANPSLSVIYSGFLNGDALTVLTTAPTVATTATTTSSAGTYPITASGAVAANYNFNYVAGILTVTPATRVFAFGTIATHTYGDTDFSPGATVNTGETISYTTSDPTVATIVNGLVHIVGAGTVTITATVASNPNYVDVLPLTQTLVINKAAQSISLAAFPVMQVGGPVLSLNIISNVGLPVTISSSQPAIAAVSGQNITALSVGSTIITVSQPGTNNYLPATYSQLLKVQDAVELVKVRPGFSPNGDGINDFLIIEGIQDYPDNKLTIVNRNGVKMFQTSGYNNVSTVFDGHNSSGDLMQAGTYFYELELHINGETKRKAGYIILKFN